MSKISIFFLVSEYFKLFLFSDFIESERFVKVNALTLTFDISSSNQLLNS